MLFPSLWALKPYNSPFALADLVECAILELLSPGIQRTGSFDYCGALRRLV